MKYGYFPGCSLKSTAREYDASVKEMCQRFGIELVEIEDWNCCGATPAHAISEEISLALPWKNLATAEAQGLAQVLSPCPACHSHMCSSHRVVADAPEHIARLNELAGAGYEGRLELKHLLDFLRDEIGLEAIGQKVTKPLSGLKVVAYYGCLNRLPGVSLDDVEQPTVMEDVLGSLGAEALRWSHASECCGASLTLTRTDIVHRLVTGILQAAADAGANCIAVCCPVCHSNLDMRQKAVAKKAGLAFDLPVLYLSQLILMSQGVEYGELGLDKHFVSAKKLFAAAFSKEQAA